MRSTLPEVITLRPPIKVCNLILSATQEPDSAPLQLGNNRKIWQIHTALTPEDINESLKSVDNSAKTITNLTAY
ncbi:MAG: hypothetical protein CL398_11890 [Acidiferrobacteraceae bacterium]|nr:hypothetical protein [Acidiferrobacteraceae bacterium]